MIGTFQALIETARKEGAKKRVASPWVTKEHIEILSEAAEANLITPIMIGTGQDIEDAVKQTPLASLQYEIFDEKDSVSALTRAMQMVTERDADILMQGGTSQKTFIDSVLNGTEGFLTSKLASFISIFQLLKRDKLILATDTFINNTPTLPEKQVILENALVLTGILEMESPKVAALASIEQVNPAIPSTLDAAILSKMSQRRQFGDVVVEGPLDIDCALDKNAAERKGLSSIVTGNVDIYLTPDIDVGYLLAQLLVFIGKMQMIGTVMGTSVPMIVDLPFVSRDNKVAEIALAALIHQRGARHG
jgi:phosphate butyryltransferase